MWEKINTSENKAMLCLSIGILIDLNALDKLMHLQYINAMIISTVGAIFIMAGLVYDRQYRKLKLEENR